LSYNTEPMPFSVRLDPETERLIAALARATGTTRSHVVREAVSAYGSKRAPKGECAYDRFKEFIGRFDSGGQELATDSGPKVRALLEAKRAESSGRYRASRRRSGSK
jgi:hypothetical protein